MSERRRQLREIDDGIAAALAGAGKAADRLRAALVVESEQDLAELDISKLWTAVSALSDAHVEVRKLRAERREVLAGS